MKKISKAELIQFVKDNCITRTGYDSGNIYWQWMEDIGSQSSKEINAKIVALLGLGEQDG